MQHPTHAAFANGGGAPRFEPGVASAMVIGGGATTRSAVYALSGLGLAPIFLLNRDDDEVRGVIESFQVQQEAPPGPELIHIRSAEDVERYIGRHGGTAPPQGEEGESRERSPNLAIIVAAIPGEHTHVLGRLLHCLSPLSCFSNSALHARRASRLYTHNTHPFTSLFPHPIHVPFKHLCHFQSFCRPHSPPPIDTHLP